MICNFLWLLRYWVPIVDLTNSASQEEVGPRALVFIRYALCICNSRITLHSVSSKHFCFTFVVTLLYPHKRLLWEAKASQSFDSEHTLRSFSVMAFPNIWETTTHSEGGQTSLVQLTYVMGHFCFTQGFRVFTKI